MTTRSGARVYRRDPRPLRQGACPQCFRLVAINSSGLRRLHRDEGGRACTGSGVRVEACEVSAEVLSAAEINLDDRRRPKPRGTCHRCDRAVTGERLYCGPCFAQHAR